MLNLIGYYTLLVLEKILILLPKKVRIYFFKSLAFLAYYLSPKYKKIVKTNLEFCFGKDYFSDKNIKEITKYSFKNLFLNIMHLIEMKNLPKNRLKQYIKLENEEIVYNAKKRGKSIVFITMHYGSWEYAGASVGLYFDSMSVVYKGLKNKIYEEWLLKARSGVGNDSLEKTGVLKKVIKLIKNKKDIGVLIDTNINLKDGEKVKFFNHQVTHTQLASFLARRYDAVIIPAVAITKNERDYTVVFYDEITPPKTENIDEDIKECTQMQANWMEDVIKKEPKFWFWLHRRFKSDYPHIYENL